MVVRWVTVRLRSGVMLIPLMGEILCSGVEALVAHNDAIILLLGSVA
jgi:hypothetical protein